MTDNNMAIVEISKAQQALDNTNDIFEMRKIGDILAASALFAERQGLTEIAQQAKILQLKANRKAGEWLKENVDRGNPNTQVNFTQLPDGIDKLESHRLQLEASVPEEKFDEWVDNCLSFGQEISAAGLQRLARIESGKQNKLEPLKFKDNKYRIIYADPPWFYGDKLIDGYGAAEHHYPAMTIDELCGLPISELSDDNAVLFLWVTSPLLEECFEVINSWGFKYKTTFVWDKIKHNFGHYNSVRHELLLVCTKGSCLPDSKELIDSVQSIERSEHSEKPEKFRQIIDRLYTSGNRIELFARDKHDNWEVWGNEPAIT
jgi:site-specific DNA-methyltransferase (adenine-specific)